MTDQPTPAQQSLSTTPGVIPYVEYHTGGTRMLTLDLTTGNSMVRDKYRPIASIDGRQYVVVWGPVTWEVPSDRNVHVSVHLEGEYVAQAASMILEPGEERRVFRYETNYLQGIGKFTEQTAPPPAQ